MKLTFVILCLGRTGSFYLVSLLNSHPDIRCFGELFSHRGQGRELFRNTPHTDALEYLREITGSVEAPAVGLKLPVNSIQAHPQALDVLGDPGLRVIRLSRLNLLALFVSRQLLAATRVPQSTRGEYGDTRVRLDPQPTVKAFERMEEHERWLDGLAGEHPTLRLTYEGIIEGEGLEDAERFLGVEPRELSSPMEKLRKRPLSETVENWDEVVAELQGTRFEHFLVEGP